MRGSKTSAYNARGVPVSLDIDIAQGNLEAVKQAYTSSNDPPTLLRSIAAEAAYKSQTTILSWALDQGLPLHPRAPMWNDKIHFNACCSDSLDVWKVLIEHGMNLNAFLDESLGDALTSNIRHADTVIVRFLLESGFDPNTANGDSDGSPGTVAVRENSIKALQLMLQYGWRQEDGETHIAAAELGNLEALRLLVEEGNADIEIAAGWWNYGIYEGDRIGTALYRAAIKSQVESVAYLLERGARTDFKDKKGRSVMWAAREGGNSEIIRMVDEARRKTIGSS